MFVSLIKMMIAPVIFCTIVLGIGSVRKAATVGKVGGLAFIYFLIMSTVALGFGLIVGNLPPGTGLNFKADPGKGAELAGKAHESGGTIEFLQGIIPDTLVSSLTRAGAAGALRGATRRVCDPVAGQGGRADPVRGELLPEAGVQVLSMILWTAPIGAFGAIAGVVSQTGWSAVRELAVFVVAFYATCLIFVFVILGLLLRAVTGFSIFRLARYLAREYLLIVATSSSEPALPSLIAKMEHMGSNTSTVGIVVPTGYSFNLDGTAIYLTMASLFIADAAGDPMTFGEQISLLLFC